MEDAAETFVVDSVRINDESDGDPAHILSAGPATVADGIGTKDPACGTEKSAPQAGSVTGQEDERLGFGNMYKNMQMANDVARSTHAPLKLVPAAPHPNHYP